MTPHKKRVLQAWIDGKKIECRPISSTAGISFEYSWQEWPMGIVPSLEGKDEHWRIAKQPLRRFYTMDEAPIGWIARCKSTSGVIGVLICYQNGWIGCCNMPNMDQDNFTEYEVSPPGPERNWQPAGVEE